MKETEKSITKVNTNRTFRLSKEKINRLLVLSVRWPNLNHDISCPPVAVKRSKLWSLCSLKWKEILPNKLWAGILNQPSPLHCGLIGWPAKILNVEGILFLQTYIRAFDWLTNQKIVKVYELVCDWLTNRECLFSGNSSIKIDVLGLDEKRDLMSVLNKRK